jgi:acyl carrier protein
MNADRDAVFAQIVAILRPFVKNPAAFATLSNETSILRDLKVNSARLVEVLVKLQELFDIDVSDEEADKIRTVGDTVRVVLRAREVSCLGAQ